MKVMKAPRDKIAGADIAKVAEKYQIRADWARWYVEQWLRT